VSIGRNSAGLFFTTEGDANETRRSTQERVVEANLASGIPGLGPFDTTEPTLIPPGVRTAPLARIDVPPSSTVLSVPVNPFAFLNAGGLVKRQDGTPARSGSSA